VERKVGAHEFNDEKDPRGKGRRRLVASERADSVIKWHYSRKKRRAKMALMHARSERASAWLGVDDQRLYAIIGFDKPRGLGRDSASAGLFWSKSAALGDDTLRESLSL